MAGAREKVILGAGTNASDLFEPLDIPGQRTPDRLAPTWDCIEGHAKEAAEVAGTTA